MGRTILYVDDEPDAEALVRQKFRKEIRQKEIIFIFAHDGIEALDVLGENQNINIVLTDINMPRMDGLTLLTKLNEKKSNLQAVIISAYGDMKNIRTAMNRGAFDFLTKPIDLNDFEITLTRVLKHVDNLIAEKAEKEALQKDIENTQKEIIYKISEVVEARSQETGNHVRRVAEYSKLLALKYGMDEAEAKIIKLASPMHDIGKVAIPDAILNKPGKLTKEEFDIIKTHSAIGYNILKNSKREIIKVAAIVAHEHHEKYNGKGYPRGITGENIHIYGRITAVADVFDALGSYRVYKEAWELDRILALFKEERGEHFDADLIDVFFDNLDDFIKIRDKYQD